MPNLDELDNVVPGEVARIESDPATKAGVSNRYRHVILSLGDRPSDRVRLIPVIAMRLCIVKNLRVRCARTEILNVD